MNGEPSEAWEPPQRYSGTAHDDESPPTNTGPSGPPPRPDYLRRDVPAPLSSSPASGRSFGSAAASGPRAQVSVLGSTKRAGVWDIPTHSAYRGALNSVKLDLRQARLPGEVVTVEFQLWLGSATIIVPPSFRVEFEADNVLSSMNLKRRTKQPAGPTGPLLRITGVLILSSVNVIQK